MGKLESNCHKHLIMQTHDVIIIGAGVVSCSIAYSLSRAGFKTLNVDAGPAPGYGSTSHSSAIVRPFYSHTIACAVAHESRSRWLNWRDFLQAPKDETLACYNESGGLVLLKANEQDQFADNLAALDEVGVDYEILSAAQLQQLYPDMSLAVYGPPKPITDDQFGLPQTGAINGAIYIPACGHVNDPQLAAMHLMTAAKRQGATFKFHTRVQQITTHKSQVTGICTHNNLNIPSTCIINAAGPHSAVINGLAGVRDTLPIATRALRHEVVYLHEPANHQGVGFLVDLDCGFYQRQDGDDWLIGTTDPDCDPPHEVEPDNYPNNFTEQWTLQAYRAAQRFPSLAIESKARGTVGLYDVSDDWIPLYDKTHLDGFYLAIGTSGNQFKNAPLIGDILAEIILHEQTGQDHDLNPAQLHLAQLDRHVDLAFYSRRRTVQTTSSVLA